MLTLPIEIDCKRPLELPKTPYAQCSNCQYVCTDIPENRLCPICNCEQRDYTIWPNPDLEELWRDEVAMWNEKRVELAAVVAAIYCESSVFHLIYWGIEWLDPELNCIGAGFEEVAEKEKRIWEYLNSIRSRQATEDALQRLFNHSGRQMLCSVLDKEDAKCFWGNYRKLAEYRNDIIHKGKRAVLRGENGQVLLADQNTEEILDWCLKFIPICWDVFAKLHNEFIHKPMWERKQKESASA